MATAGCKQIKTTNTIQKVKNEETGENNKKLYKYKTERWKEIQLYPPKTPLSRKMAGKNLDSLKGRITSGRK